MNGTGYPVFRAISQKAIDPWEIFLSFVQAEEGKSQI